MISRLSWIAFVVVLGLFWGGTIPLNKLAVANSHPTISLLFWQQLAGFLFLLVLRTFTIRGSAARRTGISIKKWKLYIVVAFVGTLLPHGLSFIAISVIQANMMSIGIAITPMAAYMLALLAGKERLSQRRALGVATGAISILLLAGISISLLGQSAAWGIAIALMPGLCYAVESTIIANQSVSDFDPVETLFVASGLSSGISFMLALIAGVDVFHTVGVSAPFFALIGSGLLHVLCYIAYFATVVRTGAVFASQVAYFVTFGAFLASTHLLNEPAPAHLVLSLALMLLGVALVQPRQKFEGIENEA